MALIDRLKDMFIPPAYTAAIASPFVTGPSHLAPVFGKDFWGDNYALDSVGRAQAVTVPALARARGLIVTTIARLPIVAIDDKGEEIAETVDFLTSTAGPLTPFHRMLWTIDDLFFYGWSLWAVERDGTGAVVDAYRVGYENWRMDTDGTILIDDKPVNESEVILFPGISEGILVQGAPTLTQAARLGRAAGRAAENPAAQVELHQTNDAPLTEADIDRIIARWARARRGENGGVAFTSQGIEVKEHGASKEHLLVEGRNAVAVDIARLAGIPATMIDATLSGSSLSYQNTAARMSELVTFGLAPYMAAVAARLSQDDVTAPGVTLRFDLDETFTELTNLFTSTGDTPPQVDPPANT